MDTIKSENLLIVQFDRHYISDRYIDWLNDPDTVRYSEQRHYRHTRESCHRFYDSHRMSGNRLWAILISKENERHIGNIAAIIDTYNRLAELTILIGDKKQWGKGYATEAWMAVCSYLFEKINVHKVTAGTLSVNKAMLKVMEKAGMINDGKRKRHYIWEGRKVDIVYRALFKNNCLS